MDLPILKLSDDRRTATITFSTNPPTQLSGDAQYLADLIAALRNLRGQMVPEVPSNILLSERRNAVEEPLCITVPSPEDGSIHLHIRDGGLGWLHFVFSEQQAEMLALHLQRQSKSGGDAGGQSSLE